MAETYLSLSHFRLFTLKNVRKSIELFFKFYQNLQEREEVREKILDFIKIIYNSIFKASFISL